MRWLPLLLLAACAAPQKPATSAHSEPLPFIEDDYPRALAAARSEKRPIFVETWAPW
jgi:hypothetical protein